jgi:hypothetical protein
MQQALRIGASLLPRPEEVVPPALAALDDPRTPTRGCALSALVSLGWTRGVVIDPPARLMQACTSDPDAELRGLAMVALGGMRATEEALAILEAGLADPQPPVRAGAVRALARLDPDRDRACAMLLRMARDAELNVAGEAVEGLSKSGPYTDEVLEAIGAALDGMGENAGWRYGSVVLRNLMQAPLPLETRLGILGRAYANPWLSTPISNAIPALGADLPEALAIITRPSNDDPMVDSPAARWRRAAEYLIVRAMRDAEPE